MRWWQPARATPPLLLLGALALALAFSARCTRSGDDGGGETAVLHMADGATIRLRFHPREAPRTTENFKKLARAGFYNGTTFHRIIPGFIIQGGDPNSRDDDPENDGYGGPGYTIPDEFNDLPHDRGTVSMAHPATPDSAGSQFFIVLSSTGPNGEDWHPVLDHKYTAFATVTEGMDEVDRLAALPLITDVLPLQDRPVDPPVIASITIEGPPGTTPPAPAPGAVAPNPARAPSDGTAQPPDAPAPGPGANGGEPSRSEGKP